MAYDRTAVTIAGNALNTITNSMIFVPGNHKFWNGARWVKQVIPGSAKLRNFRVSGEAANDGDRTTINNLWSSSTHSYSDGLETIGKVIVLNLRWQNSVNNQGVHPFTLEVEEYSQS